MEPCHCASTSESKLRRRDTKPGNTGAYRTECRRRRDEPVWQSESTALSRQTAALHEVTATEAACSVIYYSDTYALSMQRHPYRKHAEEDCRRSPLRHILPRHCRDPAHTLRIYILDDSALQLIHVLAVRCLLALRKLHISENMQRRQS